MAGIFRDGFDMYASAAAVVGLAAKWTIALGTPTIVTAASTPFGVGQALNLNGQAVSAPFDSAVSSLTYHGMNRIASFNSGTTHAIHFMTGSTVHVGIQFSASGVITAYRGTTSLGASAAGAIIINTWHAIAVECVISDTVGRVTVYVDGVSVLNLTSQDTANSATVTSDRLQLGSSTTDCRYDDIYVINSATKLTNHPRIETLVPVSDGGTLNWVPSTGSSHFALIDELPVATADYISASSVGDVDEIGLSDLTSVPISIEEVNVVTFASKTDATARTLYPGVKSGATTSDGTAVVLNATGVRYDRPIAVDPDTAAAWTYAAVNALQLRPKVAS